MRPFGLASLALGWLLRGLSLAQPLPSPLHLLTFTTPDGASQDARTLATVLPQALYAVLQQQGVPQVAVVAPTGEPLLEAAALSLAGGAQEVIGGSLTPLSGNLVVAAYRYQRGGSAVQVVRAAVFTADSPYDPEALAKRILAQLFPRRLGHLQPPTAAQIVLQPSTLNLPVGSARPLRALVLAGTGEAIPTAQVVFQSTNPAVVEVDAEGRVSALAPGQANVEAQVLGTSPGSTLSARTQVNVAPPYLGLRAGFGAIGAALGSGAELGLRLTPQSAFTPPDLPQTGPSGDFLSILGSFVGKLISSGNVSLGLEFFQGTTALTLTTTQWAAQNYLGTGLAYLPGSSFNAGNPTLGLEFYLGRELLSPTQAGLPLELEFQVLFPAAGPQVKLALTAGLDVFQ